MNTNDILASLAMISPSQMPPALIEEIHAAFVERDKLAYIIDFLENNLVAYGTGYGIAHKEMILQDEYANEFAVAGRDIFECVENARRIMAEVTE